MLKLPLRYWLVLGMLCYTDFLFFYVLKDSVSSSPFVILSLNNFFFFPKRNPLIFSILIGMFSQMTSYRKFNEMTNMMEASRIMDIGVVIGHVVEVGGTQRSRYLI